MMFFSYAIVIIFQSNGRKLMVTALAQYKLYFMSVSLPPENSWRKKNCIL